jgi:adenylate cyclase
LRVTARLLDAEKGTVLWSQTYDENLRLRDFVAIQEDVAHQVAAALAQPYGIIFRADMQRTAQLPPDDLEAYACSLRFYVYRAEMNAEQHVSIRSCLEKAVARYPDYATAWAMLAYLYLDEDRYEFNRKSTAPSPMERALTAARRAVRLDPDNVRAQQALMTVLFFNQEPAEALHIGERALALNPNDTELLGELGSRIMMAGDRQRGMALLEQALDRNPGHSGYYRALLAFGAYLQRDYERAVIEIRRADLQKFSIYHVVAAMIFAQRGMRAEASEAGAQFLRMHPKFFDNWDAELAKRNFGLEDRAHLVEGARKAGLPVPLSRDNPVPLPACAPYGSAAEIRQADR